MSDLQITGTVIITAVIYLFALVLAYKIWESEEQERDEHEEMEDDYFKGRKL